MPALVASWTQRVLAQLAVVGKMAPMTAYVAARSRHLWSATALVALMLLSVGCKHTVDIRTTPPGATVSKNGVELGKTPLLYDEPLGPRETQRFAIEQDGVERELSVTRDQLQFGGIGTGAAIGCAGCCLLSGVVGTAATFFPPLGFIGVVGPLFPIAGAIVGWFQFGFVSPDIIEVDLRSGDISANPPTTVTLSDPIGTPAPMPSSIIGDRPGGTEPSSPGGDAPPPPGGADSAPPPHSDSQYSDTNIDDDEYGLIPPNPDPTKEPIDADDDAGNAPPKAEDVGEDGFGAPIAPDELRF